MHIAIDQERLSKITKLHHGKHGPGNEMCVMEAVAWVCRKEWTDHPPCACPVIGAFMRAWNDGLNDEERTELLKPFIPKLVNTRGSKALEARRATMAADWYVRVFTPAWLRLAGLNGHADNLASFHEIVSFEKTPTLRPALEAAQKDASAAWSAARSAAWSAARSAAWSAARSAAESAAESAARSALKQTKTELQTSAIQLVKRMIALKDDEQKAA